VRDRPRWERVVLVGVTDSPVTFEAAQFVIDQKAIIGALAGGMGHAEIRSTLAAIRAGKVDVAGMVTETAPFQSLPEALERLSLGRISGRALVAM
jgi:D-arabinose 1-dehydrogenase-like Zn-dependent alcohol dehydrogenase